MSKTIIAYYRVSTEKQGASGLGLEAQRATVQAYAKGEGADIDAEYTEVESGKKSDRPKLAAGRIIGRAGRMPGWKARSAGRRFPALCDMKKRLRPWPIYCRKCRRGGRRAKASPRLRAR